MGRGRRCYHAGMRIQQTVTRRVGFLGLVLLAALSMRASTRGEVRLEAPIEYQVFERVSRSQGAVSVRGTADEGADAILITLSGKGVDGEANVQFRAPVNATTHQFDSAFITPAGGWFRVSVQPVKGKEAIGSAATVEHVGVGEVFVIAGQSNSTNYGQTPLKPASGMVATFDGKSWRLADDPQPGTGDGSKGGSCWPAFGDAMAEKFGVPIGIASTGFGGTSVNQWLPAGERYAVKPTAGGNFTQVGDAYESQGKLYDHAIERIRQLGPHGFRAVLWHQGESDSNQPSPTPRRLTGDEYAAAMTTIITHMRRDAAWPMPWITAQASYNKAIVDGSHVSEAIRAGQAKLWSDGVTTEGPDTDTLDAKMRTGVHFSEAGQRAHGQMWAEKVSPWLAAQLQAQPADNSAIVPVTQDRDYRIYDWQTRHHQVLDFIKARPPRLIVIGDSIMHYFAGEPKAPIARGTDAWSKHLAPRDAANLGFGWDRTENVLWRLDHGELEGIAPKAALVLIGTNNLDYNTADQIAAGVAAVCDRIHDHCPTTRILLLGVLPRQNKHKTEPAQVNALLAPLVDKPYITYIDARDVFVTADGVADKAKFNDEVHPSAAGYAALFDKLEPTLAKLMGE